MYEFSQWPLSVPKALVILVGVIQCWSIFFILVILLLSIWLRTFTQWNYECFGHLVLNNMTKKWQIGLGPQSWIVEKKVVGFPVCN